MIDYGDYKCWDCLRPEKEGRYRYDHSAQTIAGPALIRRYVCLDCLIHQRGINERVWNQRLDWFAERVWEQLLADGLMAVPQGFGELPSMGLVFVARYGGPALTAIVREECDAELTLGDRSDYHAARVARIIVRRIGSELSTPEWVKVAV